MPPPHPCLPPAQCHPPGPHACPPPLPPAAPPPAASSSTPPRGLQQHPPPCPHPCPLRSAITVQPGLIGGEVNRILAAHQRKHQLPIQYKLGPDPASIDSCMVGGIVNNNSSGMCCGVSQNTYHTLKVSRCRGASQPACAVGPKRSMCCGASQHVPWGQLEQLPHTEGKPLLGSYATPSPSPPPPAQPTPLITCVPPSRHHPHPHFPLTTRVLPFPTTALNPKPYHTLQDVRLVFADGTLLDTADPASREAFLQSHAGLAEGVVAVAKRVQVGGWVEG